MATTLDVLRIFSDFDNGRVSEAETLQRFDAVKVRGSFDQKRRFTGYDYERQIWIDEEA